MMKRKSQRGSLTVEASIFLVLFICAYLTIFDAVSYVRAQTAMQHAANQCAKQISQYGYILTKTGINKEVKKTKKSGKDVEREWDEALQDFDKLQTAVGQYGESPDSFMNDIISLLHGKALSAGTEFLTDGLGRRMVERNLENVGGSEYLESIGVENGTAGLSFRGSDYLVNGENRVDIVITYSVKRRVIFFEIEPIEVQVRASTGVW